MPYAGMIAVDVFGLDDCFGSCPWKSSIDSLKPGTCNIVSTSKSDDLSMGCLLCLSALLNFL